MLFPFPDHDLHIGGSASLGQVGGFVKLSSSGFKKVERKIGMKEFWGIKVIVVNEHSAETVKNIANYLFKMAQK
ncbi:hypothetical protein [Bacillus mycoides]